MEDTHKNSSVEAVAKELTALLEDLQLKNIVAINIASLCSWCEVIVIGTYTSEVQAKSAMKEAKHLLMEHEMPMQSHNKVPQSRWFVLDGFSLVMHLFNSEDREFYALEDLWSKGQKLGELS